MPASHPHRRAGHACLLLTALVLLLSLVSAPVAAQARREPGAAERELRQARAELQKIAQERRRLEGERGDATVRLRRVEEQLGRSSRELSQLEQSLKQEQQALEELGQRRAALQADLDQRRLRLARLLRAAYGLGEQAPLKFLLSQDSTVEGQRNLAYYRYAQREHSRQLARISQDLDALAATEAAITQRSQSLQALRKQRTEQLAAIQRDRGQRAAVVSELDQRFQDRQQREQALGKDVKALERLLAQLRAAAAKAQAERQAAARRAAQQQQQQTTPARPGAPTKVPPKVAASAPPPRVGGLSWPASGDLLARFGGRLPDGRSSSGVLIGAAAGAPVTAVADGTVVFSEWMTGYGLILILDHGNGYMSLYAHNESLLRDAGARVARGEQVARVGSSGGHGRPALYFELRRNGQPVDPSSWLQRR